MRCSTLRMLLKYSQNGYFSRTIVARRLSERPDVLIDDIAARTRLMTTDDGANSTIISGMYFRLNPSPTGRELSTGVLTIGCSG